MKTTEKNPSILNCAAAKLIEYKETQQKPRMQCEFFISLLVQQCLKGILHQT